MCYAVDFRLWSNIRTNKHYFFWVMTQTYDIWTVGFAKQWARSSYDTANYFPFITPEDR